jgi:acyl-coenzyme A thioesterase 7
VRAGSWGGRGAPRLALAHPGCGVVGRGRAEVEVQVFSESAQGDMRRANAARCWYVATPLSGDDTVPAGVKRLPAAPVPPVANLSPEMQAAGLARYETSKCSRAEAAAARPVDLSPLEDAIPVDLVLTTAQRAAAPVGSVARARSHLSQLMLPPDCSRAGTVTAGVVLKLMDNVAGICAVRHCHTNVVTASIDAVDLLQPMFSGDIVTLEAEPVFTSARSIQIEVRVIVESVRTQCAAVATTAMFTFVSLDSSGKTLPVPPLIRLTPAEEARFAAGQARYDRQRLARQQKAQ